MNVVQVSWVDSREWAMEWTLTEGLVLFDADDLTVVSTGFVFYEDDDILVLVQNAGLDQVKGGIAIPKCSVVSRTEVDLPSPSGQSPPIEGVA